MAGVWREAGRREEEISWEAEGSSMIAQYDLSIYALWGLYAVWSGSVHLSSVDEQVPSRQRRNAWSMSWSQRRLDWRISWCSWLRWTEVQEDSDSCISCPANKSSKNIHLMFSWDCYTFGSLLIGWVLYNRKSLVLRLGMIGIVHASEFEGLGFLFAQQLRQLKDQILIMKAALFSGAGVGAVVWRDASRRRRRIQLMPVVHWLSLIHFNNLARCGQLGLDGWLAIRFKQNHHWTGSNSQKFSQPLLICTRFKQLHQLLKKAATLSVLPKYQEQQEEARVQEDSIQMG